MGNAGRVLMIPKGEYNSATTYQMLDFVYYQGRSYVCKQTSTGNVPTNTTYWQALTGDASAEIQALTNQLGNEVTTRAALGAHNLAPLRSLSELKTALNTGTWNDDVYSIAGVDVSFLMDGNTVVGAKLNGTSTGEASIYIGDTLSLPAGEYIFSTPNKFSGDKSLYLSISNIDISMNININTKTNFTLQSNVSGGRVYIYFGSGRIFNNFEIKPMIRLATDSDSTYQPYAKTNVELTEMTAISSGTATAGSHVGNTPVYTQFGKMVVVNLLLNVNGAVANDEELLTNLPQCSSSGGRNTVIGDSSGNNARVRIASNGTSIISEGGIANTGWYSGQLIYFTD